MADGLTLSGLRDAYAAASPARKLVWGILILLLLALPLTLFWQDAQPPEEYRVLYAKLSDKDGGEVVGALEKLQIPYRLTDPDGAVQVPADQLHVARYKLAAQGLPRGDKPAAESGPRFGISAFQEQMGYQRDLEAELARSVQAVDAIESARVHLALPKQSAFLREQVPPAASVIVKLKPGARLGEQQIQSLRQIVAGGVVGMSPGQVSIVDQGGALLAAGVADFYRGLSANQLEYARHIEGDLADRISRVLVPLLGAAAFKVQVTARIDFTESEETSERSRRTGATADSMNRTVRHVHQPRGGIKQVSALIVVDERASREGMDADKLAALARQAIGFDSKRGDTLQVIKLPIPVAETPVAVPMAETPRKIPIAAQPEPGLMDDELLPVYAGLALAVPVLLLLLIVRARQRRRSEDEAAQAAEEIPDEADVFESRLDVLRQGVLADPKIAASVVKLWLQQPAGERAE